MQKHLNKLVADVVKFSLYHIREFEFTDIGNHYLEISFLIKICMWKKRKLLYFSFKRYHCKWYRL